MALPVAEGGRMKNKALVLGLLAGASLAIGASADTIRLRNGNALQGDARVLPNGDVEVHSAMGVWTVKAARVLEVVESETAEERVAKALARRPALSVEELFELALEVRDDGSTTLAARLLERVVALDPEHVDARRLLGQRRLGDAWVAEDEYRVARGEVRLGGEWTSPDAAASLLELEALEAMRDQVEAGRRLQEAQLELVHQERFLRLQEAQRLLQPSYGIPLDLYGFVGVPLLPVLPPPRFDGRQHHSEPGRGVVERPAPAAPPRQPAAPQHNRSGIRPIGR
jgi:hypothetical protein